jgi:hypothetical protein
MGASFLLSVKKKKRISMRRRTLSLSQMARARRERYGKERLA